MANSPHKTSSTTPPSLWLARGLCGLGALLGLPGAVCWDGGWTVASFALSLGVLYLIAGALLMVASIGWRER
ncbi:MAG: hypothetical protein ACYTF0_03650 [Planctomycetota bacterium]|jgi:hypothetical protein